MFKLNIKRLENDYYERVFKRDVFGGIAAVYKGVVEDINKAINTDRRTTYKNIADGIKYFATLKDSSVTMVQLTRQEAVIYQFNNLQTVLQTTKLHAKYDESTSTPRIIIADEKGNVLLYIRVKREIRANGIYVRNYIEKGKLLTQLAAQIAS